MRAAFGLLTVLGGASPLTPRALRWFPAVGAAVGAVVGLVWVGAGEILPVAVAAAATLAADLVLTGMLHADGLADAADGLLPHATPERRLEIMRTPDIGAFGVAALGAVLLLRFASLATTTADVALVAALWCASRTVVAVAPAWLPYARDAGAARGLLSTPAAWWPALALVPAGALAVIGIGAPGIAAVAAVVVGAVGVLLLARRRVGGFTGDVLGAAILLGETAGLVVASARW